MNALICKRCQSPLSGPLSQHDSTHIDLGCDDFVPRRRFARADFVFANYWDLLGIYDECGNPFDWVGRIACRNGHSLGERIGRDSRLDGLRKEEDHPGPYGVKLDNEAIEIIDAPSNSIFNVSLNAANRLKEYATESRTRFVNIDVGASLALTMIQKTEYKSRTRHFDKLDCRLRWDLRYGLKVTTNRIVLVMNRNTAEALLWSTLDYREKNGQYGFVIPDET